MPSKASIQNTLLLLGSPSIPINQRSSQLIDILAGAQQGKQDYILIAQEIMNRIVSPEAVGAELKNKLQMVNDMIHQIEATPLRPATFIGLSSLEGSEAEHALVAMENGEMAYLVVHDQVQAKSLKLGDRIMVDSKLKILVHPDKTLFRSGHEARLEKKVDDQHVEVVSHADEKSVVLAGPELVQQIDKGEVTPGRSIVLGAGGRVGVFALPDTLIDHFKYLDRGPVPQTRVEDMGNPPRVISQVAMHVREEMTRPELRRKYGLRRCITRLMCGVSGTGKSMAIAAIHRLLYEIMSEITKIPVDKLPPRVLRMNSSKLLSMWFGESDKNIDRFFDEAERLADQEFNGYKLPVLVVLEEADGLGRSRGGDSNSIYDRIMTVILQRLDPNREGLASKLVVFLSTTNHARIVDPAFLRRIGGSVEVFGRLDRKGFTEILHKHIKDLPVKGKNLADTVASHLFNNGDKGVVELTYYGVPQPAIKYCRDFLTGALIDRAVQQAATQAWESAIVDRPAHITSDLVTRSLEQQVALVAHQLHVENVDQYLDVPEGVRVTRVRRLAQVEG